MAIPTSKHKKAKRVFYSTFDGGLNLASSPETLAKNEVHEALNVEIAPLTGKMKVRGGLVYIGDIDTDKFGDFQRVTQIQGTNILLFSFDKDGVNKLGVYNFQVMFEVRGELAGAGDVNAVVWDDTILIASGGKLQQLSNKNGYYELKTLEESPDVCKFVFVRSGRAAVVSDNDTIRFSYVGDCTQWANDPDDESTGQYIEIGYKDGMDIKAVIPLSKDLIVFKSPPGEPELGIIWRVVGDFPDWVVAEAVHNSGTFTQRCVQVVGNDVYYISGVGVASLSSVQEYGEIKSAYPDRKVSNALTELITSSAELWHISIKQQLWVIPSYNEEKIWVFDYVRGIWTNFKFPTLPEHVAQIDNKVLLFIGNCIYEMNDIYTLDEMKDRNEVIKAKIRMGAILEGLQVLIKAAYASYETQDDVQAYLCIGKYRMPLKFRGTADYIYDDLDIVHDDDDSLFPTGEDVMTSRARFLVRDWTVIPELEITGGGFSISTIGFITVEV